MSYTIISARWTDGDKTSASAITVEAGEVAINKDRKHLWDEFIAWAQPPEKVLPYVLTPFGEIRNLEDQITPRRLREAVLTPEGKAWLEGIDAQIAALRPAKPVDGGAP